MTFCRPWIVLGGPLLRAGPFGLPGATLAKPPRGPARRWPSLASISSAQPPAGEAPSFAASGTLFGQATAILENPIEDADTSVDLRVLLAWGAGLAIPVPREAKCRSPGGGCGKTTARTGNALRRGQKTAPEQSNPGRRAGPVPQQRLTHFAVLPRNSSVRRENAGAQQRLAPINESCPGQPPPEPAPQPYFTPKGPRFRMNTCFPLPWYIFCNSIPCEFPGCAAGGPRPSGPVIPRDGGGLPPGRKKYEEDHDGR